MSTGNIRMVVLSMVVFSGLAMGSDFPIPDSLYHFDGNGSNAITGSSATEYGSVGYSSTVKQVGTGSLNTTPSISSYATVPEGSTITGTNNWAITLWFNDQHSSTDENSTDLFSFGASKFRLEYYHSTDYTTGGWTLFDTGYSGASSIYMGKETTESDWAFMAFTSDGSTFTAYSGRQVAGIWTLTTVKNVAVVSGDALNGSSIFYLGARQAGAYKHESAYFDELAIWNEGLSSAQVTEIFNAGAAGIPIPEPCTMILLATGLFGFFKRNIL